MPNGREKGSTFERKLAADIVKASGCLKRECFRTPLSGGHPHACPSDLQLSERLRARFPFFVEAKHRKTWALRQMLMTNSEVMAWCDQVIESVEKGNSVEIPGGPLLVMSGNNTQIFAAGLESGIIKFMGWKKGQRLPPRLYFYHTWKGKRQKWTLLPWTVVLERLAHVSSSRNV